MRVLARGVRREGAALCAQGSPSRYVKGDLMKHLSSQADQPKQVASEAEAQHHKGQEGPLQASQK